MKFVFEHPTDGSRPFMVVCFDPDANNGEGSTTVQSFDNYDAAVAKRTEHDKLGKTTKLWVDGDALAVEKAGFGCHVKWRQFYLPARRMADLEN